MNKLITSIVGKPNSGKDTLLDDLIDYYSKYQPEIISASKLIRAIDKSSPLWKEIEKSFNSGVLIPQEIVNELLAKAIRESQSDMLFVNGSISTMTQSHLFDMNGEFPLDAFIALLAPNTVCEKRAEARIVCDSCRSPSFIGQRVGTFIADVGSDCLKCNEGHLIKRPDDANIQERFDEFHQFTMPVITHFSNQPSIKKLRMLINERTTTDEVFQTTTSFLDKNFDL